MELILRTYCTYFIQDIHVQFLCLDSKYLFLIKSVKRPQMFLPLIDSIGWQIRIFFGFGRKTLAIFWAKEGKSWNSYSSSLTWQNGQNKQTHVSVPLSKISCYAWKQILISMALLQGAVQLSRIQCPLSNPLHNFHAACRLLLHGSIKNIYYWD